MVTSTAFATRLGGSVCPEIPWSVCPETVGQLAPKWCGLIHHNLQFTTNVKRGFATENLFLLLLTIQSIVFELKLFQFKISYLLALKQIDQITLTGDV